MKEKTYMTDKFADRYIDGISCDDNVLCMLRECKGSIEKVSKKMDWGITKDDLIDLCAGYTYGSEKLKKGILDFLTDINFHYECSELSKNTDDFIESALNEDSEYARKYWK